MFTSGQIFPKNAMLPSAFGFVEAAGLVYGGGLFSRTIVPQGLYKWKRNSENPYENYCDTDLLKNVNDCDIQIPLIEQAGILKNAFDLLGWQTFADLIVFTGHGSHTANNAFGSSLDCGACAANPGRHNARMLAKIANNEVVRKILATNFDIEIPENTLFLAAEHNTTTDEILLFEDKTKDIHKAAIMSLKADLKKVQRSATAKRLSTKKNSVSLAERKANDWSETRPEWGLAKNAGFIIGPRNLTKKVDLDSRCFLHSYNWKLDKSGKALETILQGPMTVTQWINNHYYFAMVDNNKFGGGNKIVHNITGRFGVVEGNGGDLKTGLPLQSLMKSDEEIHHEPLRLSVVIQAPLNKVREIVSRNPETKKLIENQWIYVMVLDPTEDNMIYDLRSDISFKSRYEEKNERKNVPAFLELAKV